jgi:hypothetical protein
VTENQTADNPSSAPLLPLHLESLYTNLISESGVSFLLTSCRVSGKRDSALPASARYPPTLRRGLLTETPPREWARGS